MGRGVWVLVEEFGARPGPETRDIVTVSWLRREIARCGRDWRGGGEMDLMLPVSHSGFR